MLLGSPGKNFAKREDKTRESKNGPVVESGSTVEIHLKFWKKIVLQSVTNKEICFIELFSYCVKRCVICSLDC